MDYKPLYLTLGIFFLVGIILNGLYSAFPFSCESNFLTDLVTDGFTVDMSWIPLSSLFFSSEAGLGILSINPFNWFGETVSSFFVTQSCAFSILPNALLIPLFVILFVGLLYTIITLIRGN